MRLRIALPFAVLALITASSAFAGDEHSEGRQRDDRSVTDGNSKGGKGFAYGEFRILPLADLRLRGEFRTVAGEPGGTTTPVGGVLARTRVGVEVRRGDTVRAVLSVQDARVLGGAPTGLLSTPTSPYATAPFEAFIEVKERRTGARPSVSTSDFTGRGDAGDGGPLSTGAFLPATTAEYETDGAYLRIGRQRLVVANGLLVGANDWSPTGRSLDAVRGEIPWGRLRFGAFAALTSAPGTFGLGVDAASASRASNLEGVTVRWAPTELFRVEAFGLHSKTYARPGGSAGDAQLVTAGARLHGEKSGFQWQLMGAYQGGTRTFAASDADVGAYAFYASAQKRVPELRLNPTFRLGGAWASGNRAGSSRVGAFDPLLPDVQTFGLLDAAALTNLVAAHGAVTVEPGVPTRLSLRYQFAAPERKYGGETDAYLTPATNVSRVFASRHEVDLTFAYTPIRDLELLAGYGILAGVARDRASGATSGFSMKDPAQLAFLSARFLLH